MSLETTEKEKNMEIDNQEQQGSIVSEKEEIIILLSKYHHNYNGVFKAKGREHILEYINNYSPLLSENNITTKLYWIIHNLHSFPKCEVCGKPITANVKRLEYGYCNFPCTHIYCSSKCAQNSKVTHELHDQTCLNKYGVAHFNNPEKTKVTCLDKYGVENVFQLDSVIKKSEETKQELYGDLHYTNKEKREETNIERYGAKNVFASEYGKNKIRESIQDRFGVDNPMQSKEVQLKAQATNLKNYGSKYTVTANCIRQKINNALLKNYNQISFFGSDAAIRRTMEEYGVPYIMMVPEIHDKSVKHRRGKIIYNDISFDTIPELAFFLFITDNFQSVHVDVHPEQFFEYQHNGKIHKYWPDFRIDEIFIEIKGSQFFKDDGTMYCPYRNKDMTDQEYSDLCSLFEAKHQCMLANNVVILSNNEYETFIEYMKSNYHDLYVSLKYKTRRSKQ